MLEDTTLELCLTNKCGGKCLFCPRTRGARITIDMSFELAKRIIDDARGLGIRKFSFGANGDALANKVFIPVVRYARKSCGDSYVTLCTNFHRLTPEISDIIISENLFDFVVTNIDGSNAESYERFKGLPYEVVKRNLEYFLKRRNDSNSPTKIKIQCITYAFYRDCVLKTFKTLPSYLERDDLPNDFTLVANHWRQFVRGDEMIALSMPYAWALRDLCNDDPKKYNCVFLKSMERMDNIYVAPNGDWYSCCYDEMQKNVFGNLAEQTISEVMGSDIRKNFMRMLEEREYEKLGYPCSKVQSCRFFLDHLFEMR